MHGSSAAAQRSVARRSHARHVSTAPGATVRREASSNPFNVPGDEEIFRHREEDKARKAEARLTALSAPVADKTTFASRMQATTTSEAREMLRKLRPPPGACMSQPNPAAQRRSGALAAVCTRALACSGGNAGM